MVTASSRLTVFVIACMCFLFMTHHAFAVTAGILTGLKITDDHKRIVVKYDGEVGRHAAFVIEQPHRLVIDFASTSLGKVTRRINLDGQGIEEIRLGQTPSRARLVVDFGDNPVPTFKIQRMDGVILVMLGSGTTPPGVLTKSDRPQRKPKAKQAGVRVTRRVSAKGRSSSSMMVKQAGVADDLVYVELARRESPNKTYRLVIDCDLKELLVRQASLSDAAGTVKRFEVAERLQHKVASREQPRPGGGPGRANGEAVSADRTKLKWGLPSVRARQPQEARDRKRGPFRLEELKLKVRTQDS